MYRKIRSPNIGFPVKIILIYLETNPINDEFSIWNCYLPQNVGVQNAEPSKVSAGHGGLTIEDGMGM